MIIVVNKTQMARHVSDLVIRRGRLERYESSISEIIRCCAIEGSEKRAIVQRLQNIMGEINLESRVLSKMKESVSNGIRLYEQNEKKATFSKKKTSISWGSAVSPVIGNILSDKNTEDKDFQPMNKENPFEIDWWDYVGEFGIIGSGISVLGKLFTEDRNAVENTKSAKDLIGVIGNSYATVCKKGSDITWKSILGLDDAYDGLLQSRSFKNLSFSEKISKLKETGIESEIDDLRFSAKDTSQNVKAITKWAGYALTFATNGIENYQEMKGGTIDEKRAVGETMIESVVDIGVGAVASVAATTIVGAAATALGFTAAPAVAVGAVGVGIVWAANGICKWATEKITGEQKDLGETVADGFYYVKEKGTEVAKAVADTTKTTVKNVGKAVANGLSTGWKNICNVFA